MKQQTAIDYFISKLKEKYNVTPKDTTGGFFNIINEFTEILEETKRIEKDNMCHAWRAEKWIYHKNSVNNKSFEEYYNEKYKK